MIGLGHLRRCLTLANALDKWGVKCAFISRAHPNHYARMVERRGYDLSLLPLAADIKFSGTDYKTWLGKSTAVDAAETLEAITDLACHPDWIVVDHYGIDERWENLIRSNVARVLVIDDLANRAHDCDLLVDQNLAANLETRYADRVPGAAGLLLGPEYALISSEYERLRREVRPRHGPVKRILINFGGSDCFGLTLTTVRALLGLQREHLEVDVVTTASDPSFAAIRTLIAGQPQITLHSNLPSLADLMANADLAIGACGTSTWERMCLGVPSLVITTAENQKSLAAELNDRSLIKLIGHGPNISEGDIQSALGEYCKHDLPEEWSRRCLELVDGRGAKRVATVMTTDESTCLHVRRANVADEVRLLEWANNPETRKNALVPKAITREEHQNWFRHRLKNADEFLLFIVETTDGVPAGQVRFEKEGAQWSVHYSVAPPFRRRGLGARLLSSALQALRNAVGETVVVGVVKAHNVASSRIFRRLGFEIISPLGEDSITYRLHLGRSDN